MTNIGKEFSEKVNEVQMEVRELKEITRLLSEDLKIGEEGECGGAILDFLRVVFDELDGIFVGIVDKNFQLLYINKAFREFLCSLSPEEKRKDHFFSLGTQSCFCYQIIGKESPCLDCPLVRAFETEEIVRVRHRFDYFPSQVFDLVMIPLSGNGTSAVLVMAEPALGE